ncbi:F-box domain-containing protein [Mycena chlorophos]|uniref:F-box domain-containing protein n=1 Tax=Mycena chlorophos TaxID=658473 RepID=A0A8H6S3T4_MYCCL|nr:F-box domain-containing protein [Mycena chlorophos]
MYIHHPLTPLPTEIISEIFLHYIPSYPARPLFHGDCSPTTLSQVCREWRALAHSTAALWRAFHFFKIDTPVGQLTSARGLQQHLEMAQTWAKRAKLLPMSVALTTFRHSEDAVEAHELALQFLVANQSRLEYLTVSLFHQSRIQITGSMPLLRRVEVDGAVEFDFEISPPFLAPNLRSFRAEFMIISNILHTVLPWGQLTHLYITHVSPMALESMLRASHALKYARVGLSSQLHQVIPSSMPPIHLNALEVFVLEERAGARVPEVDLDPVHVRVLLAALRAPNLAELAIRELFLDKLKSIVDPFESLGCSHLRRLRVLESTRVEGDYRGELPRIEEIVIHREANVAELESWADWAIE